MPKIRTLSGDEQFGFTKHSQRGSHVKLRRISASGRRETLTIVTHREVDKGTLQAIFRQALRYIPEADLGPYFFPR